MTFSQSPRPTASPWGAIQGADQIMPGVWRVDTASHGGFILSQERMNALPEAIKGSNCYGGGNAFEEDCEWSLVAVAFPDEFREVYPTAMEHIASALGSECYSSARAYWEART